MGPEPRASVANQLMFNLGVEEEEGHREGAPPRASAARACPGGIAPSASPAKVGLAQRPLRGCRAAKPRAEDEWTPERVRSYLVGLGLHPDSLAMGPDMLEEMPFGGVRHVGWSEKAHRGCFPLQFLPKWRWEPYFVTASGQEDLILGRPWVALGRELFGLGPYWLVSPFDRSGPGELKPFCRRPAQSGRSVCALGRVQSRRWSASP